MTNRRTAALIGALTLLAGAAARAERPWAVPVEGAPFAGKLLGVDAAWRLTFGVGDQRRTIPAADLVKWGRCLEQGRGGLLVLIDGSLLVVDGVTADQQRVTAESDSLGALELPLEAIAGVVFHPPSDPQRRDAIVDRIVQPTASRSLAGDSPVVSAAVTADRVILFNGDELAGLLTGIADESVRLKTDAGPVEIANERVLAIVFNPSLRRKLADGECPTKAWLGLCDGSRLLATRLIVDGDRTTFTAVGQPLTASRGEVAFLQPLGGRVVYLSDTTPSEYRQTPLLELSWPCGNDRNVSGGLLRADGRLYLKGLGVHADARLVYVLASGDAGRGMGDAGRSPIGRKAGEAPGARAVGMAARRFESLVAIDDSAAGGGSVRFHVLVDGREQFVSPILRGGDRPAPVSVDLTGAKRLELIVDSADRGDVLDRADWLDARICF
ncbi:MAG: NPCBM/NEW2 domain-containing protein [Thermoguttaceae bacterium]